MWCVPRNLKSETLSTQSPFMSRGWGAPLLLALYISHTQVAARGPFVARGVSINGPRAVLKSFFNY